MITSSARKLLAATIAPQTRRAARRASVMVYSALALVFLLGLASLAVDFGRVQTIKQDLQRCADAAAIAAMDAYADSGYSSSTASGAAATIIAQNPVDAGSGTAPTAALVIGTWTGPRALSHPVSRRACRP